MHPILKVTDNEENQHWYYNLDPDRNSFTIGRSGRNDIKLVNHAVSRKHAVIQRHGDLFLLVNYSPNACIYKGNKISESTLVTWNEPFLIANFSLTIIDSSQLNNISCNEKDASKDDTCVIDNPILSSSKNEDDVASLLEIQKAQHSQPRVDLFDGKNTEQPIDRQVLEKLAAFKHELHEELKQRLDLHAFEITDYTSPKVRRKVAERLKELIELRRTSIPRPFTASEIFKEMMDDVCGLGPIEDLMKHKGVTEIMVVDREHIYAEIDGKLQLTNRIFNNAKVMMTVIERIVIPRGRRIDESNPLVDTRLPDGSRVNAVIPPLALKDPCLTIRKFPESRLSVNDLVEYKSLTQEMARFLGNAVKLRKNIVISGGTGSGKTTLLNVFSSFVNSKERVVTIEDAAELQLQQEHVVSLETKPPNLEGKGEITIRDLVKNALRMRPDRIIVGECRGGEALDMLQAMNTGHDGSMTTVHANSPLEAISRIETLVMMAGMELPSRAIREQIANALDMIVQQARFSDGSRRITYVTEVIGVDDDGKLIMEDIYRFKQTGKENGKVVGHHHATGHLPTFLDQFIAQGMENLKEFF